MLRLVIEGNGPKTPVPIGFPGSFSWRIEHRKPVKTRL
jgi:hypothetical protein